MATNVNFTANKGRSRAKPEFQAVILAGYGSQLEPLTSSQGDQVSPKALLPILNKPMVSYALNWLEEANVNHAFIACPPPHVAALKDYIQSASSTTISVEIQSYEPEPGARRTPTTGILRKLANRIQSDLIVLSCDFVPPSSVPLTEMLNRWRLDTEGVILSTLFYEREENAAKDDEDAPPIVLFDDQMDTLLRVEYEESKQETVPMRLLEKVGKCTMTDRLTDSNCYILRRNVLDLFPQLPGLRSIADDLIPFLCTLQYSKSRRRRWTSTLFQLERPTTPSNVQEKGGITSYTALQYSTAQVPRYVQAPALAPPSAVPTTPGTPIPKPPTKEHESDEGSSEAGEDETDMAFEPSLRCDILIYRRVKGEVCGRANTLARYQEINKLLLSDGMYNPKEPPPGVDPSAQIGGDVLIGDTSRVGERTMIKRSVVGAHCIIGKNVRVVNSVLMDHVQLADGVKVENSVLSRQTRVAEGATLKGCESRPGAEVAAAASYNGVRLDGTESMRAMSGEM